MVLRCLLPLIHDDFATASESYQHMSQGEQDTLALILAQEGEVANHPNTARATTRWAAIPIVPALAVAAAVEAGWSVMASKALNSVHLDGGSSSDPTTASCCSQAQMTEGYEP